LVLKPFDPDIRRVLIPVVEAILAALTSFTLVGPLGLPWWLPLVCLAVAVGMSVGLRSLAVAKRRWLGEGLAVMRTLQPRNRLVGFVLVAVFAQIARNWLLLHAVGVEASLFDAIALLIAVVTLGQLSFGLSVGAAASVLIPGPHGVAAAAAAGVLLSATETLGGLCFAAWAALDSALCYRRLKPLLRGLRSRLPRLGAPEHAPWTALAAPPRSGGESSSAPTSAASATSRSPACSAWVPPPDADHQAASGHWRAARGGGFDRGRCQGARERGSQQCGNARVADGGGEPAGAGRQRSVGGDGQARGGVGARLPPPGGGRPRRRRRTAAAH
jgi:hypothetical protein